MPRKRKASAATATTAAAETAAAGSKKARPGDKAEECLQKLLEAYAKELKRDGTACKKFVCEHVVEILTRQHGDTFPVACNSYTRPTICKKLPAALGMTKKAWKKPYCLEAKDAVLPTVPALTAAASGTLAASPTPEVMQTRFPLDAKKLFKCGAQRFKVLTPEEVCAATAELVEYGRGKEVKEMKEQPLMRKSGNGEQGYYATLSPLPPILQLVMDACREWIEKATTGKKGTSRPKPKKGEKPLKEGEIALGTKAILLRYGEGGINYAHHDDCGEYQALLMLSTPGVDYGGGEFYLAEKELPPGAKSREVTPYPFEAAGELLVFQGGKIGKAKGPKYLHGMNKVKRGSGAGPARRFAVGFFQ